MTPPKAISVAIYEIDRAYGGPEEGGWYFDAGVPSTEYAVHTRFFPETDTEAIDAYVEELRALVDKVNHDEGRRSPSSVLSNSDYLAVETCEGFPTAYPTHRPRYE
jgi:hypothetical protein